jgi:hypothetical protein
MQRRQERDDGAAECWSESVRLGLLIHVFAGPGHVARCRLEGRMAQRLLHHAQVGPLSHHMGSEGVPEGMDGGSRDAGRLHELVDDALNAS